MSLMPETVIQKTLARMNAQPKYLNGARIESIAQEKLKNFGIYCHIPQLYVYRDLCLYFLHQSEGGEEVMAEFAGEPAPHEAAARAVRKIRTEKNYQTLYQQLCIDLGVQPALLATIIPPEPREPRIQKEGVVIYSAPVIKESAPAAASKPSESFNSNGKEAPAAPAYTFDPDRLIKAVLKTFNKTYRPVTETDRLDLKPSSSNPMIVIPCDIITFMFDRLSPERDAELRHDQIKLYIRYKNDEGIGDANHRMLHRLREEDNKILNTILGTARELKIPSDVQIELLKGYKGKTRPASTARPDSPARSHP